MIDLRHFSHFVEYIFKILGGEAEQLGKAFPHPLYR